MSAAEKVNQAPGQVEAPRQKPKLEVVKQPESLDSQIGKLTQKHRAIEAKVGQLRQVLGSYIVDDLLDLGDKEEETEQKALLEGEIADANNEWNKIGIELAQLTARKELSSAWDPQVIEAGVPVVDLPKNPALRVVSKAPSPGTDAYAYVGDPFGGETPGDPWLGEVSPKAPEGSDVEKTQEIPVSKEELKKRLPEKRAELAAAQRELETLTNQLAQQRSALEAKVAGLEQSYSSVAAQKDQFERTKPTYNSPLLGLNLTNAELADGPLSPLRVKQLKMESAQIEAELRNGPPKTGIFGFLKSALTGGAEWKAREKALRDRDDAIDEAVREYEQVARNAKNGRAEYSARLKSLEEQRAAFETNANPEYAKYAADYARQEQLAQKMGELYSTIEGIEKAVQE